MGRRGNALVELLDEIAGTGHTILALMLYLLAGGRLLFLLPLLLLGEMLRVVSVDEL